MKKVTVIILAIFFSCSKNGKTDCNYITDYYPHTAKAELEFYQGHYQNALEHYEEALRNCEAIRIDGHNDTDKLAKIYAELGKDDLALDYVVKTIEKGGPISAFKGDPTFDKLFESERGSKIVLNFDKMRKNFISSINLDLRAELQKMKEIEQSLNSTELDDSIYNVNDRRLAEIFDNHGYPNAQVIGDFLIDRIPTNPTTILLHSRDSMRINYFIPKLKEFVIEGKAPPIVLGFLYDNLKFYHGEKFTHGTYTSNSGERYDMISDTAQINRNRAEIGLPTLSLTDKIDSLRYLSYEK